MKIKRTRTVTFIFTLTIGMAIGVLIQKYYPIGNILRGIRENFPIYIQPQPTAKPQATRAARLNEEVIPEAYQGKIQLFILAGQSNMVGQGYLPQFPEKTNPRIYVFGNDYRWKIAREPIDDPGNQVDIVSQDDSVGFSPAVSFATTILKKYPEMVIGLIPCAKGNTSIAEWGRNLSDDTLYGSCLKRVRAASLMGNVAGLLFFQGEADALDPRLSHGRTLFPMQWGDEFEIFVGDFKNDLNSPELPVVFAQIGTTTIPDVYVNWEKVKEQQQEVEYPFCAMITTDDLSLQDNVHFTTESYKIIGSRFANAYLGLLGGQNK